MHNSIQLLFCFIGHFHYVAQADLELNDVVQTGFIVTEIHPFFLSGVLGVEVYVCHYT